MYYPVMTMATTRARAGRTATQANAAQLFHALSDETRLAVLDMLRSGERCVCDLQDALDAAQSRLSFHLRVLKEAGLVTDRKEGRWSYYSLNPEQVSAAEAFLGELQVARASGEAKLVQLGRSRGAAVQAARRVPRASAKGDGCCS